MNQAARTAHCTQLSFPPIEAFLAAEPAESVLKLRCFLSFPKGLWHLPRCLLQQPTSHKNQPPPMTNVCSKGPRVQGSSFHLPLQGFVLKVGCDDGQRIHEKNIKKTGPWGVKPLSPRNPLDRSSRSIQGMRPQNNWGEPAVVLMFFPTHGAPWSTPSKNMIFKNNSNPTTTTKQLDVEKS